MENEYEKCLKDSKIDFKAAQKCANGNQGRNLRLKMEHLFHRDKDIFLTYQNETKSAQGDTDLLILYLMLMNFN